MNKSSSIDRRSLSYETTKNKKRNIRVQLRHHTMLYLSTHVTVAATYMNKRRLFGNSMLEYCHTNRSDEQLPIDTNRSIDTIARIPIKLSTCGKLYCTIALQTFTTHRWIYFTYTEWESICSSLR